MLLNEQQGLLNLARAVNPDLVCFTLHDAPNEDRKEIIPRRL